VISLKKKLFSDENLARIIKILVIILLVLAVFFMAIQFTSLWTWITDAIKAVIVPIGTGYLIALIFFPLIRYLEKKGIGPRWLSLLIVFVLAAAVVFGTFFFLFPLVKQEITNFFTNDVNKIIQYLTVDMRVNFVLGTDIYDQFVAYINETDALNTWLDTLVPNLLAGLSNIALPLITVISVLPIMLFYYLKDYEMIGERLRSLIPAKQEKTVSDLGSRLNQTVGAYLRGQLLLMVTLGIVATIVYKLIGLKYFYIFGIIVGITNIIPYFGAIIAAIPPILFAFISAPVGPGPLLVLIVNLVLQGIEGNIFQPIIMGKQLSMHPLIILMSILFFGSLFGTLGIIFASPIAASIRVFIEYFKERKAAREAKEAAERPVAP